MSNRGFTLVEIIIAMAIFSVVGALTLAALRVSAQSVTTATAMAECQQNVRGAMMAMTREIELASTTSDPGANPPLQAIQVNEWPEPECPIEIVFQIPMDNSGMAWSTPIRFRHIDEDVNDNGLLDEGEDINSDGALSRRIIRIQEAGATTASTEAVVAGANDLSNVQFVRIDDATGVPSRIDITLSSLRHMGRRRGHGQGQHGRMATASLSTEVHLLN